jgi:hypothetical protein
VRKLVGLVGTAAMAVFFSTLTPAEAAAPQPSPTAAAPDRDNRFSMRDKFAREGTRYGDSDTSVRHIEHVTELQYRLRWAHVYDGPVTGNFGPLTRDAVKRYQRREGLRVSGIATHKTWKELIHDTVRRRGQVPRVCKRDGWHACYDRSGHQVSLWHNGELRNVWVARGGSSSTPTRLGTHPVYYRNIDHWSRMFDSPMPYSQFFDGGQALHGSGTMMDPFVGHSHGCVNMYIEDARQLWRMTHDKRLVVTVYGAWD